MTIHARSAANELHHFTTPTVAMTVGIPGSGKSYVASQINESLHWAILRSDGIREELTGSESDLSRDGEMWQTLYGRAEAHIQAGESVIIDATHNTLQQREFDSRYYRTMGACAIVALAIDVPLDVCLARNSSRERVVPPEVIERMAQNLTEHPVSTSNGFDAVIRITNS